MSAVDPAAPLDAADSSGGDDRMREERQWVLDWWTKFIVRMKDGSTPGDPGLSLGEFNVPFAAGTVLEDGDFYFIATGLINMLYTGAFKQLGVLETNSKTMFRQAAAPLGWTRDAALATGSCLRYVTGTPTTGGTTDLAAGLTHSPSVVQGMAPIGGGPAFVTSVSAHSLKYLDVILASKN